MTPASSQSLARELYAPFRTLLPSFEGHFFWNKMGLPLSLQRSLKEAMRSPTGVYKGTVGTLSSPHQLDHIRKVDVLTLPIAVVKEVTDLFTASVSVICEQTFGMKANPCSPYGFFSYKAPGAHYTFHCDGGQVINGNKLNYDYPCRNISFVYYLNEDFEGGEFELAPREPIPSNILIHPKEDHFILFPSDVRYPHKVHPVTHGERFAIVNWFSLQGQSDTSAPDFVGTHRT